MHVLIIISVLYAETMHNMIKIFVTVISNLVICPGKSQDLLTKVETTPSLVRRRAFTTWKTSITSSVSALSKRVIKAQNTPVCCDPSLEENTPC